MGDFGLCISGWVIKKFAPPYACVSSIPPCVVINEPNLKNIVSSYHSKMFDMITELNVNKSMTRMPKFYIRDLR